MARDPYDTENGYESAPSYPQAPQGLPAGADPNVFPNGLPPSAGPGDRRTGYDGIVYQWNGSAWIPWSNGANPYEQAQSRPAFDPSTQLTGRESGSIGDLIDPSYLAPWLREFDPGADAALPGLPGNYPQFAYQDFGGIAPFQKPTADSILQDPSYLWREGRLKDAVQNNAASHGVINSSGTIDDILSNVGNFASQEYRSIFDRDFNIWNQDWSNAFNQYSTNRDNQFNTWQNNLGVRNDDYTRALGRSTSAYNRAWQDYTNTRDTFFKNQDNPFDKLMRASELGLRAAER